MGKKQIHISDVRAFLSCRQRWDFSSQLRQNYEPDEIPIYWLVGRAFHVGMYALYELGMNPVDAYNDFIQHHIRTREPVLAFPDPKSKRLQQIDLGRQMVENYLKWIRGTDAPDEGWVTVANELPFELPLFNWEGKASRRIDLAGRFDRVARWEGDDSLERRTGSYWLWEYKTTSRSPNKEWLELDNQVTTYCHAAQRILGFPIAGVHFRFAMKKAPQRPWKLKNGGLTRAINSGAQGLSTTYDLYLEGIEDLAREQTLSINENATELDVRLQTEVLKDTYQDVLDQLATRGWDEYFITYDVAKTQDQLDAATMNLWDIGLDMAKPSVKIFPSPEWLKCQFCPFKDPCKMIQSKRSPEAYLTHMYRHRNPDEEYDLDAILEMEE